MKRLILIFLAIHLSQTSFAETGEEVEDYNPLSLGGYMANKRSASVRHTQKVKAELAETESRIAEFKAKHSNWSTLNDKTLGDLQSLLKKRGELKAELPQLKKAESLDRAYNSARKQGIGDCIHLRPDYSKILGPSANGRMSLKLMGEVDRETVTKYSLRFSTNPMLIQSSPGLIKSVDPVDRSKYAMNYPNPIRVTESQVCLMIHIPFDEEPSAKAYAKTLKEFETHTSMKLKVHGFYSLSDFFLEPWDSADGTPPSKKLLRGPRTKDGRSAPYFEKCFSKDQVQFASQAETDPNWEYPKPKTKLEVKPGGAIAKTKVERRNIVLATVPQFDLRTDPQYQSALRDYAKRNEGFPICVDDLDSSASGRSKATGAAH
jgi:hypothetical protein